MSSSSSSSSSSSNSATTDSGETSDSETTSTDENVSLEKKPQKPQTRRSEAEKTASTNNATPAPSKSRATGALRRSSASVEEDSPQKKSITAATIANSQKKKLAAANAVTPSRVKTNQNAVTPKITPTKKTFEKRETRDTRTRADSDDSDKDIMKNNRKQLKDKPKDPTAQQAPKQTPQRSLRPPLKRNAISSIARSNVVPTKSSESGSDSGSSGSGSSDSSESDGDRASDSSNSFMSQPTKAVKGKRPLPPEKTETNRKFTRSLSTRQNKQQQQQPKNTSADVTNSDTDLDEMERRSTSKSPAKKTSTVSKSKAKKEVGPGTTSGPPVLMTAAMSPPQLEKKCPIEGCDSSGHLSGYLDKHFLPEACPIYHNMSTSECKERANERNLRNEQRHKATPHNEDSSSHRLLSAEQREFLGKIKESRTRFKPIATAISTDKLKVEKECTDEDREPCLNGIVPDYDLQLFREAQAIASQNIEEEAKELPAGKGIKYITMGKYKMKVWYQSPYPDDAASLPQMYICEFCLRYRKSEIGIKRHAQKCVWRHPPGDEIYRKGKLQVWQVDGKRYKQYCQHLCLLAKFFLDHKTLYYDVEPFLFYIMTLADVDGCHTVGYFSKEKNSFYNVSCILTLPPYQRKGYGRLLIDFSYLLTRVEGKIGSPEKPLSDLGLISYRSYWKDVLLDYLCSRSGNALSIKDVSQEMAIYSYDIVSTLQALGMMKYWKGKHIVLKKQDVIDEYEERVKRRGNFPKIDETCLRWSPFVPTQANNSH